jgi:hypothetical protein
MRIFLKWLFAVAGKSAVWIPALLLIVVVAFFRLTDADLTLSNYFFAGHNSSGNQDIAWPNRTTQPWTSLYDWGVYPAGVLGCGGLAAWVLSFFWGRLRSWRDPGLFFALMLIIGPGVIVNGVLNPRHCSILRNSLSLPQGNATNKKTLENEVLRRGSRLIETPRFQGANLVGRGHYPLDTAGPAALEGEPHRPYTWNPTSA